MVFLSRAIASQHNIPYAIRQTLETPSACHPDGDIVLRKIFDSLCSQCHSATLEHHPSTSPPTTRYLETIRFTDLLTLKLAAAQLCSAWHGLSLGSPSFSTRNHSQLDYFAFGPPTPCLPRSATQHRNGTSFHSSVRRRQYARATPTALLSAAQSADVPYLPFSNKGSATGHSTLTSFSSSVAQDSTPDERQHDPLTSASRL